MFGQWLRAFGFGYGILIVAIVVNGVVQALGGTTWYGYFALITEQGIKRATASLSFFDLLFLFVLYPGVFAGMVYLAMKK